MFFIKSNSSKSRYIEMLERQIKGLTSENRAIKEELELYRGVFADAANYVEAYQAEIAKVRELKKSYEELIAEFGQIRSEYADRMKTIFD